MRALVQGFRQFADFSGKTARRDFWQFVSITQVILIILLLPAWFVFLEFFNDFISNPRVLDLLFAIAQNPDIIHQELAEEIAAIWEPYAEELLTTYRLHLICTCVAALWGLVIAIPSLAITARRLKDAGHSRLWVCPLVFLIIPLPFIADIAFICSIVTLVYCCQAGKQDEVPAPVSSADHP